MVADGKRFDLTHWRERLAQPLPSNVISCHTNFVFTTPHQNPFVGASGCCRLRQAIFAHNSNAWGLRSGKGSAPVGNRHSQLYERTSCGGPGPGRLEGLVLYVSVASAEIYRYPRLFHVQSNS